MSISGVNAVAALPIDSILSTLSLQLASHSSVILSAEPGAGKTTRVPIALLQADWLAEKKVLMLEPRRMGASRAAEYMASQLGEKVGNTVGYRIRGEARVSSSTRIEIVTEGILAGILQSDPSIADVGIVIFDEFHERSIHADLGLALTLDVQRHLRPDLRILIMSATLDGIAISKLLNNAPILESSGRTFPVETIYLNHPHTGQIEVLVASTISNALKKETGDILVFLPGQREIRRVETLLQDIPGNVVVHMLFGEAAPKQQKAALASAMAGTQKVILSTSIAETSLTIDGIRVVIDCGLTRTATFDPRRGMAGLITTSVSEASANQRRGRAGRQQSGVCYRLWTETQHAMLPRFPVPEILAADLAPFALELARWGSPNGEGLKFLDPPPPVHLAQAQALLRNLHAIDGDGRLTSHGNAMAELPVHPRISHMLVKGKQLGLGSLACEVAALLEERDLLRGNRDSDIDLRSRLDVLRHGGETDRFARERAIVQTKRLHQLIGTKEANLPVEKCGVLLALAYPERIAMRHGERLQLVSGTQAVLPDRSLLHREKFLAVGDVDGAGAQVKVFLAEPIEESDLREVFAHKIETREDVGWVSSDQAVVAKSTTYLGALELASTNLANNTDRTVQAMINGIREMGLQCLPWTKEAVSFRSRCEWLRTQGHVASDWIRLDDKQLLDTLEEWISPFLSGITRRSHLERLSMAEILRSTFSYQQISLLNRLAPTHIVVPTGSRIPVDYSSGGQPVLAVRLQEMFGQTDSPTVADGKVKVLLHLLSPALRPLAVTADLASFWKNAYVEVRKDMRGRYPRHYWPENPLEAEPTRRVKPR